MPWNKVDTTRTWKRVEISMGKKSHKRRAACDSLQM